MQALYPPLSPLSMNHQPDLFHIGIATPDDFLNPYRWVNAVENNTCPVLQCRFQRGPDTVDAYAKLMDVHTSVGQIECINEITGWLIAKACGLPVAEIAFLASIRVSDLPDCGAVRSRSTNPADALYFFCTSEISRSQATGIVANEALLDEQANWEHCQATIALDEWIGNTDRHLYNLIRQSKNQFALIDHGQLLRRNDLPPWWQTDELPALTAEPMRNVLHSNVYHCRNISAAPLVNDGFEKCADSAALQGQNMRNALYEISFWCSALAPGHSAAWLHFLHERTTNARGLLAQRFRVFNFAP